MNAPEHESARLVGQFFDRQQSSNQYQSLKKMTSRLDMAAASALNQKVAGDVLSIGGVWDFFEWREQIKSLTVMDLSEEMLSAYCPEGARGVVGDLYTHDFATQRFDSIVFPLILHHTPQGNWRSCEQRIEEAMQRARRWLKPRGHVYIIEYCPHPCWYPVQRALLPVTRRFLRWFEQPLVVMYTRSFYERVLARTFGSCELHKVAPDGFDYWAWYPVFMSIRWLRMPFALYPKMYVMSAPA